MSGVRRALALALLLGAASPLGASEPDQAYAAYQTGHFRRALTEALKRVEADSNDAAAMTLLGEIYRQGLNVPEDQKIATEWFERAAERGDVNAIFALSNALLDERSGRRDPERAAAMLARAAAAGHPAANYNLALTLLSSGRDEDLPRAVASLRIAAQANIADAQHALGILAKEGRGLPRNDAEAARWMASASANGHLPAQIEYAILLFNGTGVPRDEDAAAKLFLAAALKGNPIAQNRIARLYQSGRGISLDSIEAAAWHLAARAQGLEDAVLDQLLDRLTPEQRERAANLAATRIEGAALTTPGQTSK